MYWKAVHTKKVIKKMLITITVCLVFILTIIGALLIFSPGKPKPYLDKTGKPLSGSISEKTFISIGGIKQGMFIHSKDSTHPVLHYLHGGMPDYFLTRRYPTGLEDHFTMVWWEQRGSGISYQADIPPETMTLDQWIEDAIELTNYLRQRYGQEKIYLMGHSGGTFIGIQTAARASDLYHAYIGVAQMSDQLQSEKLAYQYMLKHYREKGNLSMVKKLELAPVINSTPSPYLNLRDKAMYELGIGTTHDMRSVITGIFLPSLTCRGYTLTEKINMWRGKFRSGVASLWNEMLATNLMEDLPKIDIPVYFLSGIYDYTASYTLSKEYLEKLQAPLKGFYTFKNSSHSPLFEEPEKTQRILREDVLNGTNSLADSE